MSRPYGTRAASAAEAGQIDPTNGVPTADPAIVAPAVAAQPQTSTSALTPRAAAGAPQDDDVVYWYSFSNHYTKRAFTQPKLCGHH